MNNQQKALYKPNRFLLCLKAVRPYALFAVLCCLAALYLCYRYYYADHSYLLPAVTYNDSTPLSLGLNPKPCTEQSPRVPHKGDVSDNPRYCPPHHALFGNTDPIKSLRPAPGKYVPVKGPCCPLPADDILTDEHIYNVEEACPENFVMTGGVTACADSCTVRCTRVNTEKYRLGPLRPAFYWKKEGRLSSSGRGAAKQIRYQHLPAGIRRAMGRSSDLNKSEAKDNCIGVPFGSLLVQKRKETCDGFFYRQLRFRETDEPVKMFPD